MRKEKKSCFRFTRNRALSAALVATSMVNLIVVGAVYSASSSSLLTPPVIVTTAEDFFPSSTSSPTDTFTPTAAVTSSPTQTETALPTPSHTHTPSLTPTNTYSPTPCGPPSGWVTYIVRDGDNLYRIGLATGASVEQLKLANCLTHDLILRGQNLHVPYLPVDTPTPSDTPNPPTVFIGPAVSFVLCLDQYGYYKISFMVSPYDPQGVSHVTVQYQIGRAKPIWLYMQAAGDTYHGSGYESGQFSTNDIISYQFEAMDRFGGTTVSEIYHASPEACPPRLTFSIP
jgi:LysM repeat protein